MPGMNIVKIVQTAIDLLAEQEGVKIDFVMEKKKEHEQEKEEASA